MTTRIDEALLATVRGGSAAGAAAKAIGGHAFPLLDVGTSLWDGYSAYSNARTAKNGVGESLAKGTVGAVRSFTLYDLWAPLVLPTPAY